MSRQTLKHRRTARPVRQELVFASDEKYDCREIPTALALVAAVAVDTGIGFGPGYVTELPGCIPGTRISAIATYQPTLWPDDAESVVGMDVPTQVRWLLPLSPHEYGLVRGKGIEALEQYLERDDVDVLDLVRP
ncbi:MAG: suppressor of fused domain protein [Myxococcales bacterium]|nr:suppressor of fused domain protein [Myxococcales bacterium]